MNKILPIFESMSIDATTLTGTLQNIGTPLSSPCLGFVAYNTSDADVILSFESGYEIFLPSNGTFSTDRFNQNNQSDDVGLYIAPRLSQFQVKHNGTVPTSGNIFINIARAR